MTLLLHSTPVALWQDIIHDAERMCAAPLSEELESYLVFLLVRYTNKTHITDHIMATEILQGIKLSPGIKRLALQEVGDKCLIFTGLFPRIAEKRLVKISYFVNLGQAAYEGISKKHNDLYNLLSHQFVTLMDVLQSVRRYSEHYPDLLPLQAYDLWNETGSQRALSVLKQYSPNVPVKLK